MWTVLAHLRSTLIPLVGVSVLAAGCATAQTPDDDLRTYAGGWFHGIYSIPDSTRLRIARDRALTDKIDGMLSGRQVATPELDTAVAVWWLSESGHADYLPTLMRFSNASNEGVATFALYGLVQHLGNESVRTRLREVDASGPAFVRNYMAVLLTKVNDGNARALLAEMRRKELSSETMRRIEAALRAPAQPEGRIHVPCLESERNARKPSCME